MAKFTLGEALGSFGWLGGFYDFDLTLGDASSTEAVLVDTTGAQIVLTGTGLEFDGDVLSGGKVTGCQFLDDSGAVLATVTNGNYSAEDLDVESFWDFVSALSAGNDTITGNEDGNDLNNFGSNHGNDTIIAGDGGSYVAGSEGKDTMRGGDDWDTLSFEDTYYQDDAKKGIVLDAAKGTIIDSWGDKDKFSGFEEMRGSIFKDKITGSKADEAFSGMQGKDVIDGGKGNDQLRYMQDARYDDGDNGIVANLAKGTVKDGFGDTDKVKNIEEIYGTMFDDRFVGDGKDNLFRGNGGTDSYDGGKGSDTVSFHWWEDLGQTAGVTIDLRLSSGQVVEDGFGNTETTKSIENIEGSLLDDILILGSTGGWAWASAGDDSLTAGRAGNWLGGGEGSDTFVFLSVAAISAAGEDNTYIDDFSQADGETIDLSAIAGLIFIEDAAFGNVAGQLRYFIEDGDTYLEGDLDGDGAADFTLELNGAIELTGNDLILA